MLFERVSRKILLEKQTPAYSVVRHDWIFKRHRVLWSDETKNVFLVSSDTEPCAFLAANTLDGFGAHKDKKYPMCTI